MSPSREEPERLRGEPGASSASGGHLPPDPGDPLMDALTAPLSADIEARHRYEAVPEPGSGGEPRRDEAPRVRTRRRRGPARRVRRTVRHVDPWSVLKLSLFFYAIFLVLWLVFVAIVYTVLDNAGLFRIIESVREGFALDGSMDVSLGTVEGWALVIGIGFAIVGSLVNVLIAILYNIASDLIGGLEMTFIERER